MITAFALIASIEFAFVESWITHVLDSSWKP
jgi:hypothetical protein